MPGDLIVDLDHTFPNAGGEPGGACIQCGAPTDRHTQHGNPACAAWPGCEDRAVAVAEAALCDGIEELHKDHVTHGHYAARVVDALRTAGMLPPAPVDSEPVMAGDRVEFLLTGTVKTVAKDRSLQVDLDLEPLSVWADEEDQQVHAFPFAHQVTVLPQEEK